MSPLRIETCRYTVDGTKIRTIQSADKTFPLEPREVEKLLDLSKTTILNHEDRKNPPKRGKRDTEHWGAAARLYDDQTILRLAAETAQIDIRKASETGLTELVGEDSGALLDIPWSEAEKIIEEGRKKLPAWRKQYIR